MPVKELTERRKADCAFCAFELVCSWNRMDRDGYCDDFKEIPEAKEQKDEAETLHEGGA